jgi:hypothetical protein
LDDDPSTIIYIRKQRSWADIAVILFDNVEVFLIICNKFTILPLQLNWANAIHPGVLVAMAPAGVSVGSEYVVSPSYGWTVPGMMAMLPASSAIAANPGLVLASKIAIYDILSSYCASIV